MQQDYGKLYVSEIEHACDYYYALFDALVEDDSGFRRHNRDELLDALRMPLRTQSRRDG
jgi:hypothetical protein